MGLFNPSSSANPTLTGSGPPTSGALGTLADRGAHYQDTSQSPPIVYENVGTSTVPLWMSLLSGNVV